jgi:hypothetical protein
MVVNILWSLLSIFIDINPDKTVKIGQTLLSIIDDKKRYWTKLKDFQDLEYSTIK